jgi:nucleoside-diphosphate-sugar epimerase
MLTHKKILVTGATGQVARPIAEFLAADNDVWCIARFTDPALRAEVEALGIKTWSWTLGQGDFTGLPDDFDYVIHAACNIFDVANDYDACIAANAEGTGLLMAHVRNCKALLYVSSLQIYSAEADNRRPRLENEPLGCHPAYSPSYSAGKIATEAVVRTLCRLYGIPTMIARLGMAYGRAGHGGVPTILFNQIRSGENLVVAPVGAAFCSLIHEDDIVAQVEPLLRAATVPAQIINWCGDETIDEREMLAYIIALMGAQPELVEHPDAGFRGGIGDVTRRQRFTGPCRVSWQDGVKSSLTRRFPDYPFRL